MTTTPTTDTTMRTDDVRQDLADRYPPIADHALVGDGQTAALVGLDGRVAWACLPRFDSPAVFASLLDADRGGRWDLPVEDLRSSHQHYLPGSAVLVTELTTGTGTLRVTDALLLDGALRPRTSSATGALGRLLEVTRGTVDVRSVLRGRDGAAVEGSAVPLPGGGDRRLHLSSSRDADRRHVLDAGDRWALTLSWRDEPLDLDPDGLADALQRTDTAWRDWSAGVRFDGPHADLVLRSAITLKLCDHHASGAVVAAPTSSLPEAVGVNATGTTGSPGSATPPTRCTRCGASGWSRSRTRSSTGCSTPRPARTRGPTCSTRSTGRSRRTRSRTTTSRGTGGPVPSAGATVRAGSCSTTCTARSWTAPTSTSGTAEP